MIEETEAAVITPCESVLRWRACFRRLFGTQVLLCLQSTAKVEQRPSLSLEVADCDRAFTLLGLCDIVHAAELEAIIA